MLTERREEKKGPSLTSYGSAAKSNLPYLSIFSQPENAKNSSDLFPSDLVDPKGDLSPR